MKFSQLVKQELINRKNLNKKDEIMYEYFGYILSSGKLKTSSSELINRVTNVLTNLDKDFNLTISNNLMCLEIDEKFSENFSDNLFEKLSDKEVKNILIRAILFSGNINDPYKSYGLKLVISDEKVRNKICEVLQIYDISMKQKEDFLYLQDSEEISCLFAFIGANKAVIKFEEIRSEKENSKRMNAKINGAQYNINKTLDASISCIEVINTLKQKDKFEKLPEDLQLIANLRVEFPNDSYVELAKKIEDVSKSKISKSGVSYKLKRLKDYLKD